MIGSAVQIALGPGMTVQFLCRNMTMDAFVQSLAGMIGAGVSLGSNPVLNQTGLKGSWNLDVKWSITFNGGIGVDAGDRVSISDAIEKQLGLKLEQRQVPTPVLIVDSVNRTSTPNPPGTAEALPPIPVPNEFDVADIKATDPDMRISRSRIQPDGRVIMQGTPMRTLILRAFNVNNFDQIAGAPKWVDTARFDINATSPPLPPSAPPLNSESISPIMRALLVEPQ